MSSIAAPPLPLRFARLVKLEHTVFALPFALIGALLATAGHPGWANVGWIVLAMVGRTDARDEPQPADRRRARRSQPANREPGAPERRPLPATGRRALRGGARALRRRDLESRPAVRWLWPIPVFFFVVYPYLKRVTWLCHLWLGASLGLAPVGAWAAVSGTFPWESWAIGGAVALWVAGFDLFYSLLDLDHDRAAGLTSWATRFGERGVFVGAAVHHVGAVVLLAAGRARSRAGRVVLRRRGRRLRCSSPTSTRSSRPATCAG